MVKDAGAMDDFAGVAGRGLIKSRACSSFGSSAIAFFWRHSPDQESSSAFVGQDFRFGIGPICSISSIFWGARFTITAEDGSTVRRT